jgi:hypothetical protein
MSDDEPIPDPLAQIDQVMAGLKMRAQLARAFYEGLIEQGFEETQAFILTRDYAGKWNA